MRKKLYTLGVHAYTLALKMAALFHPKARDWVRGRRDWRNALQAVRQPGETWIWFHCASVGEFEQGRALIEAVRSKFPAKKILLTFFSPSGYNLLKNHPLADFVCYLPEDSPKNVRDFMAILQPEMGFFIKYELWVNHLLEAHKNKVPMYLVSAKLRSESQFLLGPMAPLYQKTFEAFAHIFVQDELTARLLKGFTGKDNISVTGDTRFDRVATLPDTFEEIPGIGEFVGEDFCVVCGSTWPADEKFLMDCVYEFSEKPVKWIFAPHEINPERIDAFTKEYKGLMLKYSAIDSLSPEHQVLWIDNVGMLSRLYHYADVVYIGGGLGNGIHNTQEPAIYGNPVAFGPNHRKFVEAVQMVKLGTAKEVWKTGEMIEFVSRFLQDSALLDQVRAEQKDYMQSQVGATQRIMENLFP